MRSPPPGNDMKAQRVPVDFCSSCRTTLSRLVFEPPDCLSCPGFFFAASMKSARVLYGASALTAITAGSRTRRAIGVKSRSVTLASALTSGVCSHTPVKRPSVFGSPLFSAAHLAEKRGDPNTLGLFTGVWLQTPLVSAEAKVTLRDLTPIARLVLEPAVIAVKADAPYKTLAEFIEAAKKNPGQLKQSGGSNTSRDNVVRQLLQKSTGARWAFISFPGGGERIAALLGGHVNIMVIEPEEAGEHIRAGNLRVLAQVSEKRLAKFPEVPTLKEAGFDVPVVPQVRGVVAPPGIPKENVEFWQDFFRRLTRTPSWQKYIEDNQFEDGYQNAAELAKFYDEFTDRMREILKDAGVKTVR